MKRALRLPSRWFRRPWSRLLPGLVLVLALFAGSIAPDPTAALQGRVNPKEPGAPQPAVPAESGPRPTTQGDARGKEPSPVEVRQRQQDEVGALFPVPLATREQRDAARKLYEKAFAGARWRYTHLHRAKDPLEKFRTTKNRKHIPDPRRGGRSNNASDLLTNHLLGWLLYDDETARTEGLAIARWLAEVPDEQDHGHVQRHPALGIAAVASRDPGTRARLLSAFFDAYSRIQNSRFFVDDEKNQQWMVGMAGVRPFLRAVGAAHRFVHVLRQLLEHGHVNEKQVSLVNLKFRDPDAFLERVQDRLLQFCLWRKALNDEEKRGWTTEPGGWFKQRKVKNWPYLASRDPRGDHVTWFHVGCLWPYEMLIVETHWGKLPKIARQRIEEIATWALEIGYDGGHIGMTGLNLRSQKGTFHPLNEELHTPLRKRPRLVRLQGESAYSIAPALYFARMDEAAKKRELRRHFRTTKSSTYPGEISWATLLVLDRMTRK